MYPALSNLSSQLASVHLNPTNHSHNANNNNNNNNGVGVGDPNLPAPDPNSAADVSDQMYSDPPFGEPMGSSFGSNGMSDFSGAHPARRYTSGLSNALTQEKNHEQQQQQPQLPQLQEQQQLQQSQQYNDANPTDSSLNPPSGNSVINNNNSSNAGTAFPGAPSNDPGLSGRTYNAPSVTVPIKKDYRQLLQPIVRTGAEDTTTPVDRVALYRDNCPDHGITLFSHRSAPNGFKVAVILSELNLNYRTFYLDFNSSEQRSPSYTQMNPNGRVPTLVDHDNNDHTVWESGAMAIYLCQKAGPDCPLYSDDPLEQSQILSWIFFQTSGHAPMLGQALHFKYFHPETVPSAISRYESEVRRIYSVLEMALAVKREQLIYEMDDETFRLGTTPLAQSRYFDEPVWLVGDRCTIADLSFVTWNSVVDKISIDLRSEFPEVWKWTGWMMTRESVRRALEGHDND